MLCFPSNQFGFQEWYAGQEILNALEYVRPGNGFKTKALMMERGDVCGKDAHPVMRALQFALPERNTSLEFELANPMGTQADGAFRFVTYRPALPTDIIWNFEIFVLKPDGTPFKRYHPHPDHYPELLKDLKELLG